MLTQEDLQAISQLIKNEVEPINKRLDSMDSRLDNMDSRLDKMDERLDRMEEDIATIKEDSEITREVTNKLGEWVDFYFHDDKPYPLDEEEMEKYRENLRLAK